MSSEDLALTIIISVIALSIAAVIITAHIKD